MIGTYFHIVNIGCRVNKAECDQCHLSLTRNGWLPGSLEMADLIIINTCIVTAVAAKKTRKMFRQILAANAHAKILVSGCASEMDAIFFNAASSRVEVVPKVLLAETIDAYASHTPHSLNPADTDAFNRQFLDGRVRIGIKVQDGCNNECTYCIVHTARGREVSIPHLSVIEQAQRLDELGIAEIVLSGINLARYHDGDIDLIALLDKLLALNLSSRFRISSVEPNDISVDLAEFLEAHDGKVCRHLHMPLQSGSSKVLAEMERKYSADEYMDKICALKAASPSISITTDIICGFPGETDGDFDETLELCKAVGFSKIHVFPYSQREGTPAAERSDQVDIETRKQRAQTLRLLSEELRREDLVRRRGTCEICVIEDEETATTESYHEIKPPVSSQIGSLVSLKL